MTHLHVQVIEGVEVVRDDLRRNYRRSPASGRRRGIPPLVLGEALAGLQPGGIAAIVVELLKGSSGSR